MTTSETAKLLAMISSTFPSFKVTKNDRSDVIRMWSLILEPYTSESIYRAFISYARANTSQFAPTPAQLIDIADGFSEENTNNEVLISEIRQAIRNSAYRSAEEYAGLKPLAQHAVGTPESLRAWARLDVEKVETVILSHVRRNLLAVKERKKYNDAYNAAESQIIQSVVELLGTNSISASESDDDM